MNRIIALIALTAIAAGCRNGDDPAPTASSAASASSAPTAGPDKPRVPPPRTRVGSTVAVTEKGDAVLVAEEDRKVLWRVPTPVTADSRGQRFDLPGAPAQVLPLKKQVLVTIRQPGLLLALDDALHETGRVALPSDAWGVAVTGDAKTAVVTSAWTHQVSGVDLATMKVRWTVDVAREPRAVVIPSTPNAPAYVVHLMGTELTRIDGIDGDAPTTKRVPLPTAPSRSPRPDQTHASLGYSAALSKDERRLFVPRQALGVVAEWNGAPTVDVLRLPNDQPAAAKREGPYKPTKLTDFATKPGKWEQGMPFYAPVRSIDGPSGALPLASVNLRQPRAVAYRASTDTLLVASEGTDAVVELDAGFVEPALAKKKLYVTGGGYSKAMVVPGHGGAPSGIALSPDESKAYVFCRTTSDLAVLRLVPLEEQVDPADTLLVRLAEDDPLIEGLAKTDPKRKFREAAVVGRKLFYSALDPQISEGMACAGCHPDGRDDGHVWHEVDLTAPFETESVRRFVDGAPLRRQFAEKFESIGFSSEPVIASKGRARQTPMLAGRVRAQGGFGWHAESETLVKRIEASFRLHRWVHGKWTDDVGGAGPAGAIASFLLSGLVLPERPTELTAEQQKGKAIFESDQAGCAACHGPEDMFSNWIAVKVKVPSPKPRYADESAESFKTPSLHFVGGTPPYYHDGSVSTLTELVAQNGNRMGNTAHLSKADQAALVAYLETL